MNFETCPVCGSEHMEKQIISQDFEYKGRKKIIDGCEIIVCKGCGESFSTDESSKRIEKRIRDFHREVDGLLTSKQIVKIRKSLGFTQKGFGELLGGGTKAFAKYESSVLTQSKAMDNLIRVLDEYPEAIKALRGQSAKEPIKAPSILYNFSSKYEKNIYDWPTEKQISRTAGTI